MGKRVILNIIEKRNIDIIGLLPETSVSMGVFKVHNGLALL
jgi:hypothetical protein